MKANKFVDLTDTHIGEWHVIKYIGKGYWMCKCSCGNIRYVDGHELKRGGSKSCGHNKVSHDLEDTYIGDWHILHRDKDKKRYWVCECSCGKIKSVHEHSLISGKSKSCGHNSNELKDMLNKTIGEWHVDSYAGKGMWNCTCSCGTQKILYGEALRRGETQSCGCLRSINTRNSKIEIHGDYNYKNIREPWQIEIINNKELLEQFISDIIDEKGRQVTNQEIAEELGVSRTGIYEATKRFNIEGYKLDKYHSIRYRQQEIEKFIREVYKGRICTEVRNIIAPQELDIYLPDKHLAIEYNGNYWHSELIKGKTYHQNKTIACAKNGVHLIHIFEYEWMKELKQEKIKNYIRTLLSDTTEKIYARNTEVKIVDSNTVREFEDSYHLNGSTPSKINIGCYYKDELVGVMTFGIPRFNMEYCYELIRLCFKPSINVVGGSAKMFKYFIKKYEPKSIVVYADISKFTGNVYTRLGFRTTDDCITAPNYVWVNTKNEVLTRYQTQKHKLVAQGLGSEEETESDIMHKLGYVRVYDSGNIKLEYKE